MEFNRNQGPGRGGRKGGGGQGKNSRYNVTPGESGRGGGAGQLPQDQMNQLLLQQYFLQQSQEAEAAQNRNNPMAAAMALFGGMLGDKINAAAAMGQQQEQARGAQQRGNELSELFAAAAASGAPHPGASSTPHSTRSTHSNTPSPSPRISSPHSRGNARDSPAATAAAIQQLTAAAAALQKPGSKNNDNVAAALAAQQQWMYLDYLQRIQDQAKPPSNPPQQSSRGRGSSSGSSRGVPGRKGQPGRPPSNQPQKRVATPNSDLTRLLEQYNSPSNSLLKSSVLASAKLPADTEIIVQKNSRGGGNVKTGPPNKRGPKPKIPATITSEQAKFEQQLINLGNNNAITITPANLDVKPILSPPTNPITITPSVSNGSTTPPPAHNTPFRYGNDKRESKLEENATALPAHKYVKELYTHVIPRKPQIGLIGVSKKNAKKPQVRHHRPWIIEQSDVTITPSTSTPPPLNLNKSKLLNIPKVAPEPIIISPPDYSVPIKDGWRREMMLKSFDLNEENLALACDITYISPEGKVFSSLNEVKKSNIPDPKNFTFNAKIQLGKFVLPLSENCVTRFEYEELVEYFQTRKIQDAIRKKHLRMKHEHNSYVKLIEAFRKNKRKLKLSEKKFEAPERKHEIEELLDDLEKNLVPLETLEGKKLNDKTFANLLQIHEFLHTFGETLGFDGESLPSLMSLQNAFLHVEDNEEELVSVLCHLLICAVEDPGLPNPTGTKHLTPFGQTLKQADVTFGSMSEILRIYLNGISDSEPEAEEYAGWLDVAPFTAQSAYRKSCIVVFICDVLLQNKAVLKYLDTCSDEIHNCKKEKQQNEIRVRKLRMLVARKQVAASIEEGEGQQGVNGSGSSGGGEKPEEQENQDEENEENQEHAEDKKDPGYAAVASVAESISSDPDSKLSIEALNTQVSALGASNEKLKQQMHINSKSIRSACMGQDRWRRRYWNLYFSGGVFVEGGCTGEFEELRKNVAEKLKSEPEAPPPPPPLAEPMETKPEIKEERPEHSEEQKDLETSSSQLSNGVLQTTQRSSVFTVPPPVIKIFSFTARAPCSGYNSHDTERKITDDDLLVKHIKRDNWENWKVLREQNIPEFTSKLCEKGIREKNLRNALMNVCIHNQIPELNSPEIENLGLMGEDDGYVDANLLYKIHLGLIETLETLEERVASASLQVKGWALPSRNLIQENLSEHEIIEIVKERVLDLENAVERRYLKPPLGKSSLEVDLKSLLKETEDVSYGMLLDGPIGSTSSTRGQQINENNKLKMELKERERLEKELAARKEKEEGGGGKGERFLTHWRDAIQRTTSPSVLSMAIYILDSSIAWDKSVMKASCQLCKGGDNEDKLLLCDACDRGYHTYCFKPPLDNIPDGDWFCWECINKATGNKCCIVCGKAQLPNIKLLCCDKCVKAYHQDCIQPPVTKAPRGRWFCPDHRDGHESNRKLSLSQALSVSMNSSTSETPPAVVTPAKKSTPKKKTPRGGGGGSERDGNVSDSSNSSSFVAGNTTPAASSQESEGESRQRATTPVSSKKTKKSKKKVEEVKDEEVEEKIEEPPPPVVEKPVKMSKKQKQEMSWCDNLLDELVGHEDAWPFLEPVNTRQFPTYKKIIKSPMDLQTIRSRLVANAYKNKEAFLSDIRLIFDNCETFNEDDSPVGKAGHSLRVFFESKPGVETSNSSGGGGGPGSGSK